jgi:hypothetical protein
MPTAPNPTALRAHAAAGGHRAPGTAPLRGRGAAARVALALLSAALLLAPETATAAKRPKGFTMKVSSGTLALTLSAATWSAINSGARSTVGTTTTVLAPARSEGGSTLTFPITRGTINSITGHGLLSARGGLKIESRLSMPGLFASSSSASAGSPVLSLGSSSKLMLTSPNFTPSTIPLFTLSTAHLRAIGSRHALSLKAIPASLTASGAQFFGGSFKAGQPIGSVTVQVKG